MLFEFFSLLCPNVYLLYVEQAVDENLDFLQFPSL